jgi:hypothetical protein
MAELAAEVGLHVTAIAAVGGATADAASLTRMNWLAEELVVVLERGARAAE